MPRGSMISLALAAIAVALPGSTASAQGGGPAFAAAGTEGTLRVRITVTGEGRLPGKKSVYRAATWKARHTATLETRLVATDPTVDPSAQNQASMEDAAGAAGGGRGEKGGGAAAGELERTDGAPTGGDARETRSARRTAASSPPRSG